MGTPRLNGATRLAGWRLSRPVHKLYASTVATQPRYATASQLPTRASSHCQRRAGSSNASDKPTKGRIATELLHTTNASGE